VLSTRIIVPFAIFAISSRPFSQRLPPWDLSHANGIKAWPSKLFPARGIKSSPSWMLLESVEIEVKNSLSVLKGVPFTAFTISSMCHIEKLLNNLSVTEVKYLMADDLVILMPFAGYEEDIIIL